MNTLITQDRLDALVRNAKQVPEGLFAECGVYKGGSLKVLADNFPDRSIVGFDTFTGLPKEQWNKNEYHKPGEFGDTALKDVEKFIGSSNVHLIDGLFPESVKCRPDLLSGKKFAFVHIDFDFYEAIKAAIDFFWPRMVKGGIIAFDDYDWPNCPGVKQAIEEAKLKVVITADFQATVIK